MNEKGTATAPALQPTSGQVAIKAVEPKVFFEHFDEVYNSIAKRAFELFEGDGRPFGRDLENWLNAESELLHPVKLNITENENALAVEAEVPGFTEKDIEINLEPQRLTISGKRETSEEKKKGKTIRQEYRSDEILRVVDLPASIDAEKATATLKNGILDLQLPKQLEKAGGTKVDVKVA